MNDIVNASNCMYVFECRLFHLMVVYVYAAIAPLILPAACLLFGTAHLVYKNQALYVYVQSAESGGAVSSSKPLKYMS